MKIYSIDEQNSELLINTLRDCDYLDYITPSLPKFSVIADAELPLLSEKQALIVTGDRSSYQHTKDDIEITIDHVFLVSKNLQIVEDHRGEKYYSTIDGSEVEIKEIGLLSDNVTEQPKPIGFYKWNTDAWIEDTEAKNNAESQQNIAFLSSETRRVNEAIVTLDDAVEFGIATDEEIKLHKELRKYRVFLSRVPSQEGWPLKVEWPEALKF